MNTKFCVHLLVKIIAVLIALESRCANIHIYIPLSTTAIWCGKIVGPVNRLPHFQKVPDQYRLCAQLWLISYRYANAGVCLFTNEKMHQQPQLWYLAICVLFESHHKCSAHIYIRYTHCFVFIVASIRVIYISLYTQFCNSIHSKVCTEISSSRPVAVVRFHCSCVIGQFEMNVITIAQTIEISVIVCVCTVCVCVWY